MAQIDFKHIRSISQRDKDIVYGYMREMQSFFPDKNAYFIINRLIQDLTLLYFRVKLDTEILTAEEEIKLMQMVNDHLKSKYNDGIIWKLLFRGTRDGFKRDDFYKKCDKMGDTICIIQTPQNNVFGGFTSIKWHESGTGYKYKTDSSAFVYLIRSDGQINPEIFPVKHNGRCAISYYSWGYLSFGWNGRAINFAGSSASIIGWASSERCHEYSLVRGKLNGEASYRFEPIEIEVLQLQPK